MFLLVAVPEVLLLLGWVCRSEGLCPPTAFYKSCWIRRFPGLSIDLERSQKRGAHVLNTYAASSTGQCSRACCIRTDGIVRWPPELNFQTKNNSLAWLRLSCVLQVSCNLAAFYYETKIQDMNCIHMYCPVLESCIVTPAGGAVLYNITPGVDPDLLVFEKLSFKDVNTRSSFNKGERHGGARVADLEAHQDELSSPRFPLLEAPSPTTAPEPAVDRSTGSSAVDAADRNSPVTSTALASATDHSVKTAQVLPERNSTTTTSDNAKASPVSVLAPIQMASLSPGVVLPNNSEHLNETKVYSGRNNSSNDEGQQPTQEVTGRGTWWLLIVLCSSLAFMCCCCSIFLITGCSWKKRGRYKPRQKGRMGSNSSLESSERETAGLAVPSSEQNLHTHRILFQS